MTIPPLPPAPYISKKAGDLAMAMMNSSKEDVHGALQILGGIRRGQIRTWTTEIDEAIAAELKAI
jgi:hypothetical protein